MGAASFRLAAAPTPAFRGGAAFLGAPAALFSGRGAVTSQRHPKKKKKKIRYSNLKKVIIQCSVDRSLCVHYSEPTPYKEAGSSLAHLQFSLLHDRSPLNHLAGPFIQPQTSCWSNQHPLIPCLPGINTNDSIACPLPCTRRWARKRKKKGLPRKRPGPR